MFDKSRGSQGTGKAAPRLVEVDSRELVTEDKPVGDGHWYLTLGSHYRVVMSTPIEFALAGQFPESQRFGPFDAAQVRAEVERLREQGKEDFLGIVLPTKGISISIRTQASHAIDAFEKIDAGGAGWFALATENGGDPFDAFGPYSEDEICNLLNDAARNTNIVNGGAGKTWAYVLSPHGERLFLEWPGGIVSPHVIANALAKSKAFF